MIREKNNYYIWFQKIISTCIALFFLFSLISNLFAYASLFEGTIKYVIVLFLLGILSFFLFFFKEGIRKILSNMIKYLSGFSFQKLLIMLVLFSVAIKVFYYVFFFFDSTLYGEDISIYANIADSIVENGLESVGYNIYYLVGMGVHLSLFRCLSIPYHVGIYVVFLIGTIINFYSFSKLIGKEKSFILIALYLLMPSTSMLTFCITHELFVYLYFSIILLVLNIFIDKESIRDCAICALFLIAVISLSQTVSPMNKIWFIVLMLLSLLTNLSTKKKALLLAAVLSIYICSDLLTTKLEGNIASQNNNIEQLLIGSDLESMGRHTDGKGKRAAEEYWEARGTYLTTENFIEGEKGALMEQYKYLLTHPLKLFELLANKFYVAWSGDFYSIEYAHNMESISDPIFYIMLIASALLWLLAISIGILYFRIEEPNIFTDNYKVVLLGVVAVLLITEIMNKYSCYMTLFIYFIAFSRIELEEKKVEVK